MPIHTSNRKREKRRQVHKKIFFLQTNTWMDVYWFDTYYSASNRIIVAPNYNSQGKIVIAKEKEKTTNTRKLTKKKKNSSKLQI